MTNQNDDNYFDIVNGHDSRLCLYANDSLSINEECINDNDAKNNECISRYRNDSGMEDYRVNESRNINIQKRNTSSYKDLDIIRERINKLKGGNVKRPRSANTVHSGININVKKLDK